MNDYDRVISVKTLIEIGSQLNTKTCLCSSYTIGVMIPSAH